MTDIGRENPKCLTCDWSEKNSMDTASAYHETKDWNPSATVLKSELDTQTHRGQGATIKAEPDDQNVTWDESHQFQSPDSKEEHVHMKCESCISGSVSSKPMDFWTAVNSGSCEKVPEMDTSKVKVEPCPVNIRMNLDCTCSDCNNEPVAAGASSDVTNREPDAADINSDVIKTKPVTVNIGSDVTKSDPVRGNNRSVVTMIEPNTVNLSCNVNKNKWARVDKSSTNRYEPVSVRKIPTNRYEPVRVDKSTSTNWYKPVSFHKSSTNRYEPVRVDKSTSKNWYKPVSFHKSSTNRYEPVRVDKNSTHRHEPVRVDKNSTHRHEPVRVNKSSLHRNEPVRVDKNSPYRYEPVRVDKSSANRYKLVRVEKSSANRYKLVCIHESSANRCEPVSVHKSSTHRYELARVDKSSANSSSDVRNKLVITNASTPEFITSRQKRNDVHAGEKQTFKPFFEYLKEGNTDLRNSSTYRYDSYEASSNSRARSRSPYSSRRSRGESHSQNRRESRSRYRSRSRGRGRSNSRVSCQSESRRRSRSRQDRCSQSPPPQKRPVPDPQGCENRTLDQAHLFAEVFLDQMKPYFKDLHAHLDKIVQMLIVTDKRLEHIEEAMKRKEPTAALAPPPQPLLPPRRYPMKDTESLMLFENEMGGPAVKRRAVQFLSSIGGTCLRDTVKRLWMWLLCPQLAVSFTLTGKGKGKGRLRDLPNLLDTVYEAVRQKYPAATSTELDGLTRHFLSLSFNNGALRQEREAAEN